MLLFEWQNAVYSENIELKVDREDNIELGNDPYTKECYFTSREPVLSFLLLFRLNIFRHTYETTCINSSTNIIKRFARLSVDQLLK